jgi:hypothetical protein
VFTKSCYWTLSWASWIQFAPSIPISLRSILMLSSHLRLGLPSGLFPSGLPTKTFPHACHMSRPPHPPWFKHPNNTRWRIPAMKFHHFAIFSTISLPPFQIQISSSTLCSQEPSVYVPPSKWETKFRTYTVQLAKLQFIIYNKATVHFHRVIHHKEAEFSSKYILIYYSSHCHVFVLVLWFHH